VRDQVSHPYKTIGKIIVLYYYYYYYYYYICRGDWRKAASPTSWPQEPNIYTAKYDVGVTYPTLPVMNVSSRIRSTYMLILHAVPCDRVEVTLNLMKSVGALRCLFVTFFIARQAF
jgi:hypothetical protein